MHNRYIGSFYWQKRQHHRNCPIQRMSVNRESMIFSFACRLIYVPIGCIHPFIKYWQPLLAKTTAKCSLPHSENDRQLRVRNFSYCIIGNEVIALFLAFITELLSAIIGKNTLYHRYNTNSKLIYLVSWKAYKNTLLIVENAILIRYN
jgi:hypothetical protein